MFGQTDVSTSCSTAARASSAWSGAASPGANKVVPLMYRIFLTVALLSARAESGLASYYGGRGHKGEMTCAHRTRALGTTVTVTYAGHSIQCRINDRGPFVRGRVIDVSVGAARALGMMRSGIVPVSVE